jgi:hypothetical protein
VIHKVRQAKLEQSSLRVQNFFERRRMLREGNNVARVYDEGANARRPMAIVLSERKNSRCASKDFHS